MAKKSIDKWQFGDFQTPIDLARKVVKVLKCNHGVNPDVIVEPTCGKGSFVRASCEGFEIAHSANRGYFLPSEFVPSNATKSVALAFFKQAFEKAQFDLYALYFDIIITI